MAPTWIQHDFFPFFWRSFPSKTAGARALFRTLSYERELRFAENWKAYTLDEFRAWYGEGAQEKWDNSEIAPFDVFRKKE